MSRISQAPRTHSPLGCVYYRAWPVTAALGIHVPAARGAAAAELLTLEAPARQKKMITAARKGGDSGCDRESLQAGFHPEVSISKWSMTTAILPECGSVLVLSDAKELFGQTLPVVAEKQSRGHWGTSIPPKPLWRPSAKRGNISLVHQIDVLTFSFKYLLFPSVCDLSRSRMAVALLL